MNTRGLGDAELVVAAQAGDIGAVEMEPVPEAAERPAYTLRRLVAQGWGVPFGRTAEQLADEATAAGFEVERLAPTDFGRFVVARRPV